MKYRGINVWVACLCLLLAACDKDENNNSNNFATGIVELPALRNGANDVFVTHYGARVKTCVFVCYFLL